MCARFSLASTGDELERLLDVEVPDYEPRYNIAPTQDVIALIDGHEVRRFRWGLVPPWSKDLSIGTKMLNARSETAAEKPSFRPALAKRRCLIPASSFFEWREEREADLFGEAVGKPYKQPYRIGMKGGELFTMAGLYENWKSREGEWVQTCTILTTGPNAMIGEFHDRMPVIVPVDRREEWIDADTPDPAGLLERLGPYPADRMAMVPVTRAMSNPRFESAEAIEALVKT